MERKCKRCESYKLIDGKWKCELDGVEVDPESRPRLYEGHCFEKRQRLTPVELRQKRSEAGRKGGLAPHNRKPKIEKTQIQVNRFDHAVLVEYGAIKNLTLNQVIHHFARIVLQDYKDIQKPKGWIDEL